MRLNRKAMLKMFNLNWVLVIIIALVFISAAVLAGTVTQFNSDTVSSVNVSFNYYPGYSYVHNITLPANSSVASAVMNVSDNQNTPYLMWTFSTGHDIYATPTIADGIIYIGSLDSKIYAINISTGLQKWSYTTGSNVLTSPAIVDGVVYAGSWDGDAYAINASTGLKIWNTYLGSLPYMRASPAVVDDIVYFGTDNPRFFALNTTDGSEVWNYSSGPSSNWYSSPAVKDGVLYAGNGNDYLYALNAITGAFIWNFTESGYSGDWIHTSPTVSGDAVIVGSNNYKVYSVYKATGTKKWDYTTGGSIWSSPTVANSVVYIGSNDGKLYALNEANGAFIWSYDTGDWIHSSPVVANGIVYVGSRSNYIYAINATDGSQIWNYSTGGWVIGGGVISGGVLSFGSYDNKLYAFNIGGTSPDFPQFRQSFDTTRYPSTADVGGAHNISVDVGNDGTPDFSFTGKLASNNLTNDFSSAVNSILPACSCTGCAISGVDCMIPINISADSGGVIFLSNLDLTYCTDSDGDGWNVTTEGGLCGEIADCNDGDSTTRPIVNNTAATYTLSSSETLNICPGIYNRSPTGGSHAIIMGTNSILNGNGATLLNGDGISVTRGVYSASNGAIISNLTFDGYATGVYTTANNNNNISNIISSAPLMFCEGVFINAASDVLIENATIVCWDAIVSGGSCGNVIIRNSNLTATTDTAIKILATVGTFLIENNQLTHFGGSDGDIIEMLSPNAIIRNNTLSGTLVSIGKGISIANENATIYNNSFIYSGGQAAIRVPSNNVNITDNYFSGTYQDGINLIGTSSGAIIERNIFDNVGYFGVNLLRVGDVSILNNTFKNINAGAGGEVGGVRFSLGADVDNITISYNNFSDSKNGIYLDESATSYKVTNLLAHHNYFYNSSLQHALINHDNGGNSDWNDSIGGNFWDDILTLNIYDTTGDEYGDGGNQYPYNATYGNVVGVLQDYAPITTKSATNAPVIDGFLIDGLQTSTTYSSALNMTANVTDVIMDLNGVEFMVLDANAAFVNVTGWLSADYCSHLTGEIYECSYEYTAGTYGNYSFNVSATNNASLNNVSGDTSVWADYLRTPTPPVINSYGPSSGFYGGSVSLEANITDVGESVVWANFTLTDPYGTPVISNVNGSQAGDNWTSSPTYFLNGTYTASVNAFDGYDNTSQDWSITITNVGASTNTSLIELTIPKGNSDNVNVTFEPETFTTGIWYNVSIASPPSLIDIGIENNRSQPYNSSSMESKFTINVGSGASLALHTFNATYAREDSQADTWEIEFRVTVISNPVNINSYGSLFLDYGNNTFIFANITDPDVGEAVSWANFILTNPYGVDEFTNVNGTQVGDIWQSASIYFLNGTYDANVNADDYVGSGNQSQNWTVTVSNEGVTINESSISYTVNPDTTTINNITLTPDTSIGINYNVTTNHNVSAMIVTIDNNASSASSSSIMESEFSVYVLPTTPVGTYDFNATWAREDSQADTWITEFHVTVDDQPLTINSCTPSALYYGNTTFIECNITDADTTITWANFTLTDPYGVDVFTNVNGSVAGDIWNTTTHYFLNGTYNAVVNVSNRLGKTADYNWSIPVTKWDAATSTASVSKALPQGNSFTQNITFTPETDIDITYNVTTNHDPTNFTIIINNNRTAASNNSLMESEFIVTAQPGAYSGIHYFNATWAREDSQGDTWTVEFTVTVSALWCQIEIINESDFDWIETFSTTNTSTSPTFWINNTGNYPCYNTNIRVYPEPTYTDLNPYITSSDINFILYPGTENMSDIYLVASGVPAGEYRKNHLRVTSTNATPSEATTTTSATTDTITLIVNAPVVTPIIGGGGGGGAIIQTTNITTTTVVGSICGNDICDEDETYLSCPADCGVEKLPFIVYLMALILIGIFIYQLFIKQKYKKDKGWFLDEK